MPSSSSDPASGKATPPSGGAPLRLAIVGCGAVAAIHHLPALTGCPRLLPTLLVDADRARAEALAARFGVPEVATDYRDVAGRCDAAIVALPNALHAPASIELLSHGVHVLVEKPMALDADECDRMIAAAAATGTVLAVGLEFRFFDTSRLVHDLLASGSGSGPGAGPGAGILGEIQGFDLRQGVLPRWPFASDFILRKEAAGGGVLADFGVHVLDLLLWWLGDWKTLAYRDDNRGGLESDCELDLTLRSGASGKVEISRTRTLRNTCIVTGERGTLEVGIWDPDPPITLALAGRPAEEVALVGRARYCDAAARHPEVDFREAFKRQFDDFAGAVLDRRAPLVPGEEGRRSMSLIAACYQARRPLLLPWDHPRPLAAWDAAGDAAGSEAP